MGVGPFGRIGPATVYNGPTNGGLTDLPMLPSELKLKVIDQTKDQFYIIQSSSIVRMSSLIIATDAGREGRWSPADHRKVRIPGSIKRRGSAANGRGDSKRLPTSKTEACMKTYSAAFSQQRTVRRNERYSLSYLPLRRQLRGQGANSDSCIDRRPRNEIEDSTVVSTT